jgi:hypothetical protein
MHLLGWPTGQLQRRQPRIQLLLLLLLLRRRQRIGRQEWPWQ